MVARINWFHSQMYTCERTRERERWQKEDIKISIDEILWDHPILLTQLNCIHPLHIFLILFLYIGQFLVAERNFNCNASGLFGVSIFIISFLLFIFIFQFHRISIYVFACWDEKEEGETIKNRKQGALIRKRNSLLSLIVATDS